MSAIQWRGRSYSAGGMSAAPHMPRVWRPAGSKWTEAERKAFWRSVRCAECRVLQNMEKAVTGLFYPPGGLPVVLYASGALLELCHAQFAGADESAQLVVKLKAQALHDALIASEAGDSKTPAFE